MKNGKSNFGFSYTYIKYGKFGRISPGHFIKHKPLISEECRQICMLSTGFVIPILNQILKDRNASHGLYVSSYIWAAGKNIVRDKTGLFQIHPIVANSYCRNPLGLNCWIPTVAVGLNWLFGSYLVNFSVTRHYT